MSRDSAGNLMYMSRGMDNIFVLAPFLRTIKRW